MAMLHSRPHRVNDGKTEESEVLIQKKHGMMFTLNRKSLIVFTREIADFSSMRSLFPADRSPTARLEHNRYRATLTIF